jgi:microcystin-dependent protein
MSEPFLGQIQAFGFNFAPRGWAFCNGQILPIAQNTALFSLLGTTYGGNGQTTFALPNLQSRVPVHFGQGPGLSPYDLGEQAGSETVTLTTNQIPAHQHAVTFLTNSSEGGQNSPAGNYFGKADPGTYASTHDNTLTGAQPPTGIVGGNQPHTNIQPYLALNFCIALEGIFPSRN